MTPGLLREALAHHAPDVSWPDEPDALLAAVERHSEAHPGDPVWTQLVLAALDLSASPPALPHGLRARDLVRVDPYSTTWTAFDAEGEQVLVRAPRREASPVHRRILDRDRRGLARLVTGLTALDGVLVAPAPGTPLDEASVPRSEAVRVLGDALGLLSRWRTAGLSPGLPAPAELRLVDGRLRIVALTPGTSTGAGLVEAVVGALPRLPDGPIARFVEGLRTLNAEPGEVEALFQRALADTLGQQAVELRRRRIVSEAEDQRGRLLRAVTSLADALGPPAGKGPIGYDLDGHATRVESDGHTVRWGSDTLTVLFTDRAFDAADARRFLRACATAPTRPDTGGDPAVTDALGRWVSAGLKLRTVRLLLERA
ncbi:MAG: hypothetical protein R3F61_08405 [Myxococcota bacterium]